MKALKEKRIGLRSLWRRGLVILSLFALVFASCNNSDDGGTSSSVASGKVPIEIRVKTQPKNASYEGKQVDLTGLELEARYAGSAPNDFVPITVDLSKIGVVPKYTQASLNTYRIYTIGDGVPVYTQVSVTVRTLLRADTTTWAGSGNGPGQGTDTGPGNGPGDSGAYYATGAQIYVDLDSGYQKTYRVDDFPDFRGIKLQGDYSDNTKQNIPLAEDMRWEIRPNYANGNATGPGYLVISIGGSVSGNTNIDDGSLWTGDGYAGYGPIIDSDPVTVRIPLTEVYQVTKIELDTEPTIPDGGIFYWDDDRDSAWLNSSGTGGYAAGAKIKVYYSDGSDRVMGMQEAVRQNTVYWNFNPNLTERPATVTGIDKTVRNGLQKAKTFWPYHKNPQITFYYRGLRTYYDVLVFTKFSSLSAEPKKGPGEVIEVDMTHTDNDWRGRNATWFADQITVKATFTAYSDSNKSKDRTLTYEGLQASDITSDAAARQEAAKGKPFRQISGNATDWLAAQGRRLVSNGSGYITTGITRGTNWDGGPLVYTMNFGDPGYTWDVPSQTWKKGGTAWGESSVTTNNNRTRNVTVYYTPGIGPGPATAAYEPNAPIITSYTGPTYVPETASATNALIPFQAVTTGQKSARVQVLWSNIPTP
jgi:hypothetical protein